MPQPHAPSAIGSVSSDRPFPDTRRGACRHLREAANGAAPEGTGRQGIMNNFRLRARELRQGLSQEERRRFKRHVKPIYDSHRNRLPLGHYERLRQAIDSGAITVRKGKVERIATNGLLLSGEGDCRSCRRTGRSIVVSVRPISILHSSARFSPRSLRDGTNSISASSLTATVAS